MPKPKTHFEQVPVEMIERIVEKEIGNVTYGVFKVTKEGEIWIADLEELGRAQELIVSLEKYWPGKYILRESPGDKFVN